MKRQHWYPWIALAVGVALSTWLHMALLSHYPERRMTDGKGFFPLERHFVGQAGRHAKEGSDTLLPGNLDFARHAPFFGHVLSRLAPRDTEIQALAKEKRISRKTAARELYLRAARRFHIVVHVGLWLLLFSQGRLLGLRRYVALIPPLLLSVLPRHLFHIHSVTSEPLYMVLQSLGLTLLIYAIRRRSVWLGAPAGLVFGFGVLTQTSSLFFLPLAPLLFFVTSYYRNRVGRLQERLLPGMGVSFWFLFLSLLVITPQVWRNIDRAFGPRIAAYHWLVSWQDLRPRAFDSEDYIKDWKEARQVKAERAPLYNSAIVKRELEARADVQAFVDRRDPWSLAERLARLNFRALISEPSMFELALGEEILGTKANIKLRRYVGWDRFLWRWAFVVGGLLGLVAVITTTLIVGAVETQARSGDDVHNSGWLMIGTYVGYSLLALWGASALIGLPITAHQGYQMAPFLCLSLVGGIAAIVTMPSRAKRAAASRRASVATEGAKPENATEGAKPENATEGAKPENPEQKAVQTA